MRFGWREAANLQTDAYTQNLPSKRVVFFRWRPNSVFHLWCIVNACVDGWAREKKNFWLKFYIHFGWCQVFKFDNFIQTKWAQRASVYNVNGWKIKLHKRTKWPHYIHIASELLNEKSYSIFSALFAFSIFVRSFVMVCDRMPLPICSNAIEYMVEAKWIRRCT